MIVVAWGRRPLGTFALGANARCGLRDTLRSSCSARSAPSEGWLEESKEGRFRTFALGLPSRRVLPLLAEESN